MVEQIFVAQLIQADLVAINDKNGRCDFTTLFHHSQGEQETLYF
jgi:hypothetical protein